ncbi:hypothetical protein J4208_01470 [Candidatus Woesearchaeota archaeon]|nr:hypothetical protein [Candidatus Woesearchaeota archaeon]
MTVYEKTLEKLQRVKETFRSSNRFEVVDRTRTIDSLIRGIRQGSVSTTACHDILEGIHPVMQEAQSERATRHDARQVVYAYVPEHLKKDPFNADMLRHLGIDYRY